MDPRVANAHSGLGNTCSQSALTTSRAHRGELSHGESNTGTRLHGAGIEWGPVRAAEVSYWVDERSVGRGIVPTALALAVDHCSGLCACTGLRRASSLVSPLPGGRSRSSASAKEGSWGRQVYVNGAWRAMSA